jgi:hypothetical protein
MSVENINTPTAKRLMQGEQQQQQQQQQQQKFTQQKYLLDQLIQPFP